MPTFFKTMNLYLVGGVPGMPFDLVPSRAPAFFASVPVLPTWRAIDTILRTDLVPLPWYESKPGIVLAALETLRTRKTLMFTPSGQLVEQYDVLLQQILRTKDRNYFTSEGLMYTFASLLRNGKQPLFFPLFDMTRDIGMTGGTSISYDSEHGLNVDRIPTIPINHFNGRHIQQTLSETTVVDYQGVFWTYKLEVRHTGLIEYVPEVLLSVTCEGFKMSDKRASEARKKCGAVYVGRRTTVGEALLFPRDFDVCVRVYGDDNKLVKEEKIESMCGPPAMGHSTRFRTMKKGSRFTTIIFRERLEEFNCFQRRLHPDTAWLSSKTLTVGIYVSWRSGTPYCPGTTSTPAYFQHAVFGEMKRSKLTRARVQAAPTEEKEILGCYKTAYARHIL
jgi:hypothetical protein